MKKKWFVYIGFSSVLLGCGEQEPFPLDIGSGRNELKRSYCADLEKCKGEAFYRHGKYIQKHDQPTQWD